MKEVIITTIGIIFLSAVGVLITAAALSHMDVPLP